jgi:hypothetical protein
MKRPYLSQVAPPGGAVPTLYHPVLLDIAPAVKDRGWGGVDGRTAHNLSGAGTAFLGIYDVIATEHTALLADTRITYLPTERADLSVVQGNELWTDITLANRTAIITALETAHIPLPATIPPAATVGDVYRWIKRRLLLRRYVLKADDWTEGLATLVSAMVAAKRTRLNAALTAAGFDTSVVLGSDTIRAAIRKLVAQDTAPFFRGT